MTGLRLPRLWQWLSVAAAVLAWAGSGVGLAARGQIYGREAVDLADQAVAQDIVNLVIVAPLTVLLSVWARRGSVRAYTAWLGCLAFTAYSYAIYAFSIHFGPLFLVWVAVLGLAFFSLVGALVSVDAVPVLEWFGRRPMPLAAGWLGVAATAFGLLWLSQIVPDLVAGRASTSAALLDLPTNPVQVLDLALFLPAVLTSAALLLRRRPLGYATAPGVLLFLALTCLPVLVTPLVALVDGRSPNWGAVVPLGVVLAATVLVLRRTLRDPRPRDRTVRPGTASALQHPRTAPPPEAAP